MLIAPILLVSQFPKFVWGPTRELTHWLILGTLAPLAGLSQLKSLILSNTNFTGQSVSEICVGTTSSQFDRPILGTLAPLADLSQLQALNLSGDFDHPMKFEGQILKLCGNNKGAHPLADFQEHWLLWLASAN